MGLRLFSPLRATVLVRGEKRATKFPRSAAGQTSVPLPLRRLLRRRESGGNLDLRLWRVNSRSRGLAGGVVEAVMLLIWCLVSARFPSCDGVPRSSAVACAACGGRGSADLLVCTVSGGGLRAGGDGHVMELLSSGFFSATVRRAPASLWSLGGWCYRGRNHRSPPPLLVPLVSARHGGELWLDPCGGGACSVVLLQVGLCWNGFVEAGRRRLLSLWLSSEAEDDGLAGARGGVPADGRSKATDSGFVSDDSCGTQRSKAAIELLLASGVWFSRSFPPAAFRRRRCSAAASGDGVVRSLDLKDFFVILCLFRVLSLFLQDMLPVVSSGSRVYVCVVCFYLLLTRISFLKKKK